MADALENGALSHCGSVAEDMTAEIAIVNRSAVALAADSAVTIGRDRVWKTTNKLFSLSPGNDIGVMIYGAGDFIGFPWETVVKLFRKTIDKSFNTVSECKDSFIDFLKAGHFHNEMMHELSSSSLLLAILDDLGDNIKADSALEFRKKLRRNIDERMADVESNAIILDIPFSDFDSKYKDRILSFSKEEYRRHITKSLHRDLVKLSFEIFRRADFESGFETGVVFAGFGKDELFPVVLHCIIDGMDDGQLRHWTMGNSCDFNKAHLLGTIVPFAQNDMTRLFLEGVVQQHTAWIAKTLRGILDAKSDDIVDKYTPHAERLVESRLQREDNKKIVSELLKEFRNFRQSEFVDPVLDVISNLPKEDMAQMAEALVELTSLRRKVGSKVQSVSGPVDVAVISKGDGFVWIKRKHYFDVELNRDFLYRKYGTAREVGHEETEK